GIRYWSVTGVQTCALPILLPTLGGQTGLNLAMDLHRAGVLTRHSVRFLGADAEVIRRAEDREAFKQLLLDIGEPVPPSSVCESEIGRASCREKEQMTGADG